MARAAGDSGVSGSRFIGQICLDDNVNSFVTKEGIVFPYTGISQQQQMVDRFGRTSLVRYDASPTTISVKGKWIDGGGKYFRDFKAALLSMSQASFQLGDGTEYRWVDVVSVNGTLLGGESGGTDAPQQAWGYVATVKSYEAVPVEISPMIQDLGVLSSGSGTFSTDFSYSYSGTYFAEPTWQAELVIPSGVTVSQVKIQNTLSGETSFVNVSLTNGTFYLEFDASGSVPGSSPNNNMYTMLAANTFGYGVTQYQVGGAVTDIDFVGNIPTLIVSSAPTVPPSATNNEIVVSITANGTLTSTDFKVLAPRRFIR